MPPGPVCDGGRAGQGGAGGGAGARAGGREGGAPHPRPAGAQHGGAGHLHLGPRLPPL